MTSDTLSIKCSCGSDQFEVPNTPKESDTIKCAKCGNTGKYGDVMNDAKKKAALAVEKQLKDIFRKAGFK